MSISTQPQTSAQPAAAKDLAHQIFETMLQMHGVTPGHRPVHAKGLVCRGTFSPSAAAPGISKAAHFQKASVPVTVRFSDAAPDPSVADNSPDASPSGMAIRFHLSDSAWTDIVALSHNGFAVGTGAEFLELQKAVAAIDPAKPHPWEIELFLGAHPLALKFVQDCRIIPASFAHEAFFGNNAFIFVNKNAVKQAGRYQILPVAGLRDLSDEEAKKRSVNFLIDDLKTRLAAGPINYRLMIQLPNAGDPTHDSSLVWPDDRKTIDAGLIAVTSFETDNDAAERGVSFFPTNLTEGIELSDDPLPALRSEVYDLSVKRRQQVQAPK
jgi:catalase